MPEDWHAADHAIGCALLSTDAARVVIELAPRDWPSSRHREAAYAIGQLLDAGADPDPLLVAAELRRLGHEPDLQWMHAAFIATPSISSVGRYCQIVQRYARDRRLVEHAAALAQAALEHDDRRITDALDDIAHEAGDQ